MSAPASVAIIGSGSIGTELAERLHDLCRVRLVSARRLLTMSKKESHGLLSSANIVVFAHGANVNSRFFDRDYDDLLSSRVEPLRQVARLGLAQSTRYILVSSTVAFLEEVGERGLVSLQATYEWQFKSLFARNSVLVLRFGTVFTGRGSVDQAFVALQRTLILKRLRIFGGTNTPFVGPRAMQQVAHFLASGRRDLDGQLVTVAENHGLDLNSRLDQYVPVSFALPIPLDLYSWVFARFGIRPEFFRMNLSMIDPQELARFKDMDPAC